VIAVPLRLRFGLEDRENNELAPTINLASTALAGQIQESTEDGVDRATCAGHGASRSTTSRTLMIKRVRLVERFNESDPLDPLDRSTTLTP
jgi:hypothetical protein